jgi:O-acetyl-ADP-ribose deacetylase (regulator of RNase III)
MSAAPLPLAEYRELVALDRPFVPSAPAARSDELGYLARRALEMLAGDAEAPDARPALAALLTVREPGPLPEPVVPVLDALLGGETELRGRVDPASLPTIAAELPGTRYPAAAGTVLWLGDITTLGADAIVNAANSGLRGCFLPGHACIDNAIHSAAGPWLRNDCDAIVTAQGFSEPPGGAKITRGYHLPARYVLHTVGPVVAGAPGAEDAAILASCYRSCLDLAAEISAIRTVAFCAVSTGVFGYPVPEAARVALTTVAAWVEENPGRLERVVFDVFSSTDAAIYADLLTRWETPS